MNSSKRKVFFSLAAIVACISLGQYLNVFPIFPNANSEENNIKDIIKDIKKVPKKNIGYLTCSSLSERMKDFLKNHYIYRSFDKEISARTFDTFFKLLDPNKLYFTQDDIDLFRKQEVDLFKNLTSIDCRFISGENGVYEKYKKRVAEATLASKGIIQEKINFSIDEYIETDRKKLDWAKSPKELTERWRKTIKFILLNMKDTDDVEKIRKRLIRRYEMIKKDVDNRTNDDINSLFLNSFALSLDPHSSFLTPTDNTQFQIEFSLKLVGIGATLRSIDGYTVIDAIVPGGAAAKDGRIKKNDKITAVDSGDGSGMQDVIEMDLNKVVQLIRGKEGTIVKLAILRKETDGKMSRNIITLKRAVVQIKDYQAKSEILNLENKKIGVINLPNFYIDYKECQDAPRICRSSSNDMAREVKKLKAQKVDGILIDLRRNGGGDLTETQKIVGLFIKDPVVTQVEDRERQVRSIDSENKDALYTGPLAILVSKYSASASEILSGAVQDYGRGLIVGDSRTFGKGTVQTIFEVPGTNGRQSDGAIHVTIAKFFRPSGKSNQEKGIISDIIIPDIIDATDIGEQENDYALPYTTIKPSRDFKPERNFREIIPKLQKLSAERVEKSSEFKKITEAMEKVKNDKNTLVSLKELDKVDPKKSADKKPIAKKTPTRKDPEADLMNDEEENADFSAKVIRKNDIVLREASNILIDSAKLIDFNSKQE
ncbi:carboxy terminal-processing peptidase [Fluviispira multicolorata]|uniref:PDZ domain-containing protein n=1 Tax=Fluviispira multicolorata TaxID=2654512 RepID=A0A833JF40_9BACT|nr:carboxy terminal-processing peptidase [Fluviispira multicolorata]KAB8033540.1 hypothetical protein GCL57_02205 [Fluviispira multicolorata]